MEPCPEDFQAPSYKAADQKVFFQIRIPPLHKFNLFVVLPALKKTYVWAIMSESRMLL